ncbi:hypothetical protein WJX72_002407 [[Myrmecia] bisecta]|uniref:Chromo domain-containing protein n=1 Tax=[Myrmecia] bisecta TaxID=41462 RepID=A0AAW1R500_9CHLO
MDPTCSYTLRPTEDNKPQVQYLVKWKDGSPDTWEPAQNLADNLLRDFEDNWWTICKKGDEEAMRELLANSGQLLAQTVNADRRSALHFAAAIGNANCVRMLCQAGAEVDLGDKEGYTPLHMASGYFHVSTVQALIEAGADPEVEDSKGRNIVQLVESLRETMPLVPETLGRRMALEDVAGCLTENLFEDVEPIQILDARTTDNGTREFLVQWPDGVEDSWVAEKFVAEDVIEDYDEGLEYANAECILDVRQKGDQRTYLVRWQDDCDDTWEPEENVSPDIIALWEEQQQSKTVAEQQHSLANDAPKQHSRNGNGVVSDEQRLFSRRPAERPAAVTAS